MCNIIRQYYGQFITFFSCFLDCFALSVPIADTKLTFCSCGRCLWLPDVRLGQEIWLFQAMADRDRYSWPKFGEDGCLPCPSVFSSRYCESLGGDCLSFFWKALEDVKVIYCFFALPEPEDCWENCTNVCTYEDSGIFCDASTSCFRQHELTVLN